MPGTKTYLVTGAGGSIGSEICRHLAGERLVLFDQSEYGLFRIAQETGGTPILGDCRDEARVLDVMERYRPDYVFHVAAYKHVPMLEGENAFVGVRNNVLGTLYTARHAKGVYVLVSTDKAVNPSCVMGASKRLCEHIAAEHRGLIVRFGNVLDSAGSVLPTFRAQIERGGPVTVTHPDVERYFMTIPAAAQLVLKAAAIGRPAATYMLDMGRPVKILDVARQMIADARKDIAVKFIGLRPGEKLSEEISYPAEDKVATSDPAIYELKGAMRRVTHRLSFLDRQSATEAEVRRWLIDILPECRAHFGNRKLSVVENTSHSDPMGDLADSLQVL